jgi:hypothetical protein
VGAIWERDQGAEPVSYVKEMLTSQTSLNGFLGALATGTLLAFPYGFGVATIPVLCFSAALGIAAMFVPNSARFRHKIDRAKRAERRAEARAHLIDEIRRRVPEDPLWELYDGLCQRVASLYRMVRGREGGLSTGDLERLDDATVDFLGLWLGRLTMTERLETVNERALREKLRSITAQLEKNGEPANRKHLQQARADIERILTRRERLVARQAAVEAAQLSLADTFDEVYQGVMTHPRGGDIGRQLQEAVERLHIEEDLDLGVEEELDTEGLVGEGQCNDRDHARRVAEGVRLRAREPHRS